MANKFVQLIAISSILILNQTFNLELKNGEVSIVVRVKSKRILCS